MTDDQRTKQKLEQSLTILKADQARAQEALQIRDRFIATAAHEMKTPITSLQLLLQMLLKRYQSKTPDIPKTGKTLKMLEDAFFQTKRLNTLTTNMLDVARISAGKLKLNLESLSLVEVLKNLLKHFQEDFHVAKCDVSMTYNQEVNGIWDKVRLEQVMVNLLTNAMKYGGGKPIHVTVDLENNRAILKVIDHGIGISDQFQTHLFERFERAETAEFFKGCGLGLWISRQIIQAHHGSIRVKSVVGVGSVFTIELPLQA